MQPANWCTVASVAERFQLVVPGLAEQHVQTLEEISATKGGHGYRMLDSIFGNHDVAVDPYRCVEDA